MNTRRTRAKQSLRSPPSYMTDVSNSPVKPHGTDNNGTRKKALAVHFTEPTAKGRPKTPVVALRRHYTVDEPKNGQFGLVPAARVTRSQSQSGRQMSIGSATDDSPSGPVANARRSGSRPKADTDSKTVDAPTSHEQSTKKSRATKRGAAIAFNGEVSGRSAKIILKQIDTASTGSGPAQKKKLRTSSAKEQTSAAATAIKRKRSEATAVKRHRNERGSDQVDNIEESIPKDGIALNGEQTTEPHSTVIDNTLSIACASSQQVDTMHGIESAVLASACSGNNVFDCKSVQSMASEGKAKSKNFRQVTEKRLVEEYFDVSKRMNVPHQPLCMNNIKGCSEHHKNKFKIDLLDDKSVEHMQILIRLNKPTIFLRLVSDLTLQKTFPRVNVIVLVLEHILAINQTSDDEYNPDSVKDLAAATFAKIIESHPPCCAPCKQTYKDLIASPLGNKTKLPKDKFNPNWSLLSNILHILELIIEQGQIDNGNVSLNETEDYSDFLKWSSRNDQKYSFDKLTREEKVERIFLVLNLLLQLMESDLVMWSIAYGDNPAKKMAEQRKYSLIAHFLWPDGPAGEVNQRVKSILNMFVQYVSIDFAPHKIGYLARLINLIYHAVYLTEVKGEHMQYPIMPRRCQILCDTLNKAIETNQAYGTTLYLNVLKHLQTPGLKWLLCTKFLNKSEKKPVELRPKAIHDLIVNNDYLQSADDQLPPISEEDTLNASLAAVSFSQYYPCLEKSKQRKKNGISDSDYISVLRTAFKAYTHINHITDIIDANREQKTANKMADRQLYAAEVEKHTAMAKQTVDYEALESQLQANPNIFRETVHNSPIFPYDVTNQEYKDKLVSSIDIKLSSDDISRYREDIKYHDEIKNIIAETNNNLFSDWFEESK